MWEHEMYLDSGIILSLSLEKKCISSFEQHKPDKMEGDIKE